MTDADKMMIDLARLAVERTRKAVMSVGQLIEDDHQRGHMLVTVAMDLVRGAAATFEDDSTDADAALAHAVAHLVQGLGIERIQAAIAKVAEAAK